MSAAILPFSRKCPKPSEVVSAAEGQMQANLAYWIASWRFWFYLWGIE